MTANSIDRECKLACKSFFCSKRMLRVVNSNGQKALNCTMDNGECLGYMCNYAECRDKKMTDAGKCLKPMKSPLQTMPPSNKKIKYDQFEYITPNQLDDKLRKKLAKKY